MEDETQKDRQFRHRAQIRYVILFREKQLKSFHKLTIRNPGRQASILRGFFGGGWAGKVLKIYMEIVAGPRFLVHFSCA